MASSKFATVQWIDAVFNHDEDPGSLSHVTNAGWIIHEDEEKLTLAMERHHYDDAPPEFRNYIVIPKSCIESITRRRLKGL